MDAKEVAKQRKEIEAKIIELEIQIAVLRLDLEKVRIRCAHERTYNRSYYDGSTSRYCSDCGKEL